MKEEKLKTEKRYTGGVYLSELAQLYFPKSTPRSALHQLHRWIELNPQLTRKLQELYYKPRQRALTPLQYEAVIEWLGEPGE